MALNSIEDDAPAVTEHAHYVDHSLPTPEPSGARFRFAASPRAQERRHVATHYESEEEIFEEIGPGTGELPVVVEDGNIESPFQSTETVYV
jgi:hypothetical protein